jgi:hypothetical protein
MPSGTKIASIKGGLIMDDDHSSTNTYYSDPTVVTQSSNLSFHCVFASTSAFTTNTVELWATNIPNPGLTTDADWVLDTTITFTGAAGASANELAEVGNAGAAMYRIKTVNTSGTGNLKVWVCIKDKS